LNCSSFDKSGRVRDRLNQAMTAHQLACDAWVRRMPYALVTLPDQPGRLLAGLPEVIGLAAATA
jgi:hypothetical protein